MSDLQVYLGSFPTQEEAYEVVLKVKKAIEAQREGIYE